MRRRYRSSLGSASVPPFNEISAMIKLYSAVCELSTRADGAFVGTIISGVRYCRGKTVVTIHAFVLLLDVFSFFLAAIIPVSFSS